MKTMKVGFKDKNGRDLELDQTCRVYDKTGKEWIGKIVIVDPRKVIRGLAPQFALKTNYPCWINNQRYASTLEILNDPDVVEHYDKAVKGTISLEDFSDLPQNPSIEEYLDLIAARLKQARKQNYTSADSFWHLWSLHMHRIWIKVCDAHPDSLEHKAAFVYWWNRNEFLRLWSEHRYSTHGRQRKLQKDSTRLHNTALGKIKHKDEEAAQTNMINILRSYAVLYQNLQNFFNPPKKLAGKNKDAQQP